MEFLDRDAAVDDADALRLDIIIFFKVIGEEMRDGDDAFALGEGGIIKLFEHARDFMRAVEARDIAGGGALHGPSGAPGGSAAAGMHDIHVVGADDFPQAADIGGDDERVFTCDGQGDVGPARFGDLTHAVAARGDDDRMPARADDGGVHVDDAALDAA